MVIITGDMVTMDDCCNGNTGDMLVATVDGRNPAPVEVGRTDMQRLLYFIITISLQFHVSRSCFSGSNRETLRRRRGFKLM